MRSLTILDRFANWLCSQMWIWGWAEKRGSRLAVRVCRLCMARSIGVSIGWAHLVGKLDLNDALASSALEKTTAWQEAALGGLGPLESEEGARDRPTRAAIPQIVEIRATDGWVVTMPDWFFNGIPDSPREAVDRPPPEPDEKVQIGPLDV